MKLQDSDILFIKTHLTNANDLITASDAFELLNALDELSVATMDENDEITDIGREAERLIDRIVFDERYQWNAGYQPLCASCSSCSFISSNTQVHQKKYIMEAVEQ